MQPVIPSSIVVRGRRVKQLQLGFPEPSNLSPSRDEECRIGSSRLLRERERGREREIFRLVKKCRIRVGFG